MVMVSQRRESEVCYRLLETIRQYAEEELLEAGEADWTARRHFEYYLAEADQTTIACEVPAHWMPSCDSCKQPNCRLL